MKRLRKEQPSAADHLLREWMIHVCKDGTITYRNAWRREPVFNGMALPVFSVDTEEQAQAIQVRFGRRMYGEHPQLPGKVWYSLSSLPDGTIRTRMLELSDLDGVTERMREFWDEHLTGAAARV